MATAKKKGGKSKAPKAEVPAKSENLSSGVKPVKAAKLTKPAKTVLVDKKAAKSGGKVPLKAAVTPLAAKPISKAAAKVVAKAIAKAAAKAAAAAANTIMSALYPTLGSSFATLYNDQLTAISDGQSKTDGINWGNQGHQLFALVCFLKLFVHAVAFARSRQQVFHGFLAPPFHKGCFLRL
jgi:hypothetical protein